VGIKRKTRVFLDGECLYKVFGIVGGGDRKDMLSLIRILILSL
jgi:hypothetical protein